MIPAPCPHCGCDCAFYCEGVPFCVECGWTPPPGERWPEIDLVGFIKVGCLYKVKSVTDPKTVKPVTVSDVKALRKAIKVLETHLPQGQYRDEVISYLSELLLTLQMVKVKS